MMEMLCYQYPGKTIFLFIIIIFSDDSYYDTADSNCLPLIIWHFCLLHHNLLQSRSFSIDSQGTFQEGKGWPVGRIDIKPGSNFYLPITFNPPSEESHSCALRIGTSVGDYVLELTGTGREAVLSVAPHSLSFDDCLVGNEYTKELTIINAGDLFYPVNIFVLQTEEEGKQHSLSAFSGIFYLFRPAAFRFLAVSAKRPLLLQSKRNPN